MATVRPKDLPSVSSPSAGDKLLLDGATARSITIENVQTNILAPLNNVNNTSDVNKPVSTAQAAAINAMLPKSGGTMTGPLVLAADPTAPLHPATKQYADGLANSGSFKAYPSTAITRPVQNRLRETLSILDFSDNAGTGDANIDTAAIQNAVAYLNSKQGGTIYFPQYEGRSYLLNQPISPTQPILFQGQTMGRQAVSGFPQAASTGTTIKWAGGSDHMFALGKCWAGGGVQDMILDGNNTALSMIRIDALRSWRFKRLYFRNLGNKGLVLGSSDSQLTCSWNHFEQLEFEGNTNGHSCIHMHGSFVGNTTTSNSCHNTFIQTNIVHGGTRHGIVNEHSDNNVFMMTFLYGSPGTTGYNVYNKLFTDLNGFQFPVENAFFHVEANGPVGHGFYCDAGITQMNSCSVYGMHQSVAPVTNGSRMSWFDTDGTQCGGSNRGIAFANPPTWGSSAGSGLTVATDTALNYRRGRLNRVLVEGHVTALGTASGEMTFTVPFAATNSGIVSGYNLSGGNDLTGYIGAGTSIVRVRNFNSAFPVGNGDYFKIEVEYETASA